MTQQQFEKVVDELGITWVPGAHDRYRYAGKIWSSRAMTELLIKELYERKMPIGLKPVGPNPLSELQILLIWIRTHRPCETKVRRKEFPTIDAVITGLFGGDDRAFRVWLVDCLGKLLGTEKEGEN